MGRSASVVRVAARPYWREADARVIVEAWQRSGEPLSAFARRYRIHRKRLARWAAQLERSVEGAVTFHPVRVVSGAPRNQSGHAAIEVVLAAGHLVRVPPGCAPADVQLVFRVLSGEAGC